MAIIKTTDDVLQVISKLIGELLFAFATTCLRGWFLSICAGLIFPGFALGFWQWVLIAFTVRLMIVSLK